MALTRLELGCGLVKAEGWLGIDKQELPGVDIVHDLTVIPYPLKSDSLDYIRAIHVMEHICPMRQFAVMDELWRLLMVFGVLELNVPVAGSEADYWNPEHCARFHPRSWELFDPRFKWFYCYNPKPWRICDGYPIVSAEGTISVMLNKMAQKKEGD